MEDGEAPVDASAAAAVEGDDVVKMEIKAEEDKIKEENGDDEIIELGDIKEHYDQDVQLNNKGAFYRVTLVMVKNQINFNPGNPDDWCNLPYESLRALDSATLAFVRCVSTCARTDTSCVLNFFTSFNTHAYLHTLNSKLLFYSDILP